MLVKNNILENDINYKSIINTNVYIEFKLSYYNPHVHVCVGAKGERDTRFKV